ILPLAACTAGIQDAAPGDDRRRHLMAILPASAPHSSLGAQADVFDRFVDTWDSEYVTYAADGTTTRRRGEVIFGWIIDGRALQDMWITYTNDEPARERDMGTSIRFWDARSSAWRVVGVHLSTGVVFAKPATECCPRPPE